MRRNLPTSNGAEQPLNTYEDLEALLGRLSDDSIRFVPAPKTSEEDWLSGC